MRSWCNCYLERKRTSEASEPTIRGRVDKKDELGNNVLHSAARCGHEIAVRFLLENGANIKKMERKYGTVWRGSVVTGARPQARKLGCE